MPQEPRPREWRGNYSEHLRFQPDRQEPRTGAEMISAERHRQVSGERWTPEHDDDHNPGELADAAGCYVGLASTILANREIPNVAELAEGTSPPDPWPWSAFWWKPSGNPIDNLVKAGALIAAEIDRLQRKERHDA